MHQAREKGRETGEGGYLVQGLGAVWSGGRRRTKPCRRETGKAGAVWTGEGKRVR
ncbi:MAG: hypothetical protein M0Z41_16000 [Peptococcaceae bacterium]|nr:hypothetical protein [Peptococcaceae bacterium]